MANHKPGRLDRHRTDLEQDYEVRDWGEPIGLTAEEEFGNTVNVFGDALSKFGAYPRTKKAYVMMDRDPAKRITAFGIAVHEGEVRAVLLINDRAGLVVESNGLNHEQAELLCDGYADGLRESADLSVQMIGAFLDDPDAIAALEVPLDRSPADKDLFKQGAIGGLRLATAGYWIDADDTAGSPTIH